VLANVPTYMIFDDHDVTDDWNLTARWRHRVHASPAGRRIVANALAAYWAFQGWGNDPRG
jgi:phosphodiesterase/alkaline phosphatase D-like protein